MTDYSELSPMQSAVLKIPEKYNVALLGGRGGGKTTAGAALILAHIAKYPNDASCLICRKTFRALTDFEGELLQFVAATVGAGNFKYNRSEKIMRIGNARIELAAFDDERSWEKIVGKSHTFLLIDEVTQYASENRLRLLRSTLRGPKQVQTRVAICGNPGGKLHARIFANHIKDRQNFVPYTLSLGKDTDETEDWVTVQSVASANTGIDVAAYEKRLREATAGDDNRLQQWLYGRWDQGASYMFASFDEDGHVLAPPRNFMVNPDEFRPFVAIDWGISAPSVALLCLIAKESVPFRQNIVVPRGSIYILDEVTDVIGIGTDNMNTSHEWHPALLAEKIIARFERYGVTRPSGVVDSARGLRGEMLHTEMQKEGFWRLVPPKKGKRAEGWTAINSMLQAAVEKHPSRPHLGISPDCKYLLATLPFMSRDEDDPDDIAPIMSCPGHALDALRYAVAEGVMIQPEITWQPRLVY